MDTPALPTWASGPPPARTKQFQRRVLVAPKSACLPAVPSLVTAMGESLNLKSDVANSGERPSIDSGFAESLSTISTEDREIPSIPVEVDSIMNAHTLPREKMIDPFQHEHGATVTPSDSRIRALLYELALNRIQSGVDKAAGIRRRSLDSLRSDCEVRRSKSATILLLPDIEEAEGVPLFRPWTIGDQSIGKFRNPRMWVSIVKNKFRRIRQ